MSEQGHIEPFKAGQRRVVVGGHPSNYGAHVTLLEDAPHGDLWLFDAASWPLLDEQGEEWSHSFAVDGIFVGLQTAYIGPLVDGAEEASTIEDDAAERLFGGQERPTSVRLPEQLHEALDFIIDNTPRLSKQKLLCEAVTQHANRRLRELEAVGVQWLPAE